MMFFNTDIAGAVFLAAAAKFTGSGGAIVAFCPDGSEQEEKLRAACEKEGFSIEEVRTGPQHFRAPSHLA